MIYPDTNRPVHGGNLTWAAQVAGCSPGSLLDFSASISPLGPPQTVLDAILAATSALNQYPDPSYTQLCCRLAQHHQLTPEQVLPGNGAAELLTWACRDLAASDAVVLPVPAFGDYYRGLRGFDATIVVQPMRDELGWLDQEAFVASLRQQARRYVCPALLLNNPHNPTGTLLERQWLRALLDDFELVVVDEAFMDFIPSAQQQSALDWIQAYPNLVVLRSQTKFYSLPGLRLGYAIGHPDRLERWRQWRDPWPVNGLAVAAAIAALEAWEFQQRTWSWLAVARPQLYQGLQEIADLRPLPSCVNFYLVRCNQPVPPLQLALLKNHQILIRDCLSFAELGDRYFRVALKTEADNQRLLAALQTELNR